MTDGLPDGWHAASTSGTADRIRDALAAVADPDRAGPMQAYMKSEMPLLGVLKPARTEALRPILADLPADREVWLATAASLWEQAQFREERYAALAVLRDRRCRGLWASTDLPVLHHLITTGAWWDLVDETAVFLLGPLRRRWRWNVRPWAIADDMWLRRAAIICQVGAKQETDAVLLAEVLTPNVGDRRFFVAKAIGWALRDYARTDPQWVRGFLAEHGERMAPLSVREAGRHLA